METWKPKFVIDGVVVQAGYTKTWCSVCGTHAVSYNPYNAHAHICFLCFFKQTKNWAMAKLELKEHTTAWKCAKFYIQTGLWSSQDRTAVAHKLVLVMQDGYKAEQKQKLEAKGITKEK